MGTIEVQVVDGGVGVVTITNPAKLNAWNRPMRQTLSEKLAALIDAEPSHCRAIVITGAEGNFCAGQDLDEAVNWDDEFAETWVGEFRPLYDQLRRSPKPIVAAVPGVAAGSGFQYALCADYRVAHSASRLGQPEIKSGQASVTGSWLTAMSIGITQMRALVLTARLVSGDDAYRMGLVDQLEAQDDVLPAAIEVAREMSDLPAEAFSSTKLALCELEDEGLDRAFAIAIAHHASVYATGAPRRSMTEFMARSGRTA